LILRLKECVDEWANTGGTSHGNEDAEEQKHNDHREHPEHLPVPQEGQKFSANREFALELT
jgi:hypothetical protein